MMLTVAAQKKVAARMRERDKLAAQLLALQDRIAQIDKEINFIWATEQKTRGPGTNNRRD